MKLIFKQRLFSWLCSYDVYREDGSVAFTVKGQLSFGHCLKIYDAAGRELGTVQERVLTLLPQFEIYLGGQYIGRVLKEFTLFQPKFTIECNGWTMQGDFFEWDYRIYNRQGLPVATVTKALLNFTDTYVLEIRDPGDALPVLMLALAIDAEKCSREH